MRARDEFWDAVRRRQETFDEGMRAAMERIDAQDAEYVTPDECVQVRLDGRSRLTDLTVTSKAYVEYDDDALGRTIAAAYNRAKQAARRSRTDAVQAAFKAQMSRSEENR
ncbi:MAG: YbaB/EbfC family nucleoid-associated protein [Stackebrandtia sp.]